MAHDNLTKAKKNKNDEFYTQFSDIQKEINAYLDFNPNVFKGKTVLLPCDDPEWSNFTKFFCQNFVKLGLKKIISTSYAHNSKNVDFDYQPTLFETVDPRFEIKRSKEKGKIFTLTADENSDGKINIDDLKWNYLEGDGDFRSEEVKKLRDEADIIVTNPPFSLFREFISWIYEAKKQFIVIGSLNAIGWKEIFPIIKRNEMWLGNGFSGGNAFFGLPKNSKTEYVDGVLQENGLVKFRNCCWYTNIDHGRRHQKIQLMSMADNIKFSKHKDIKNIGYQHYDNYDAIEVPYVDSIPSDYKEMMGVPISFLDKYNPEQFEIIGFSVASSNEDSLITKSYNDYIGYKQDGTPTGRTGSTFGACPVIVKNDGKSVYYEKDGIQVQATYARLFIKSRG